MATIRKRGKAWRAEVFKLGIRESKSFDTKSQASIWAAQREMEILSGDTTSKSKEILDSALQRYAENVSVQKKGSRWEIIRINAFRRDGFFDFINKKIFDITPNDVALWRDARLKEVSPGTVLREMNLLRSIFEVARREWGYIKTNPMTDISKPRSPKHREKRINAELSEKMCFALGYEAFNKPTTKSHRVALAFLFALETAMRAGEICGLTGQNVYKEQRFVTLLDTKNGDRRNVPLSRRAVEILDLLDNDFVFDLATASIDALFRKAKKAAGIDDLHFHDTRHEALTRLSKKVSVLDLAKIAGHRDPRSLMIYYNPTASEIAQLLD